jgi:hypothetical protein
VEWEIEGVMGWVGVCRKRGEEKKLQKRALSSCRVSEMN